MSAPPDPQKTHDLRLQLRHSYRRGAMLESNLAPDWLGQLRAWLEEADGAGILEPNAMVLSTVGPDGAPTPGTSTLRFVEAEDANDAAKPGPRPPLEIRGTGHAGRTTGYSVGTSGRSLASGERFGFASERPDVPNE